jgi:hypothetical protein
MTLLIKYDETNNMLYLIRCDTFYPYAIIIISCARGSRKEVKIQELMYRDTTNVEPEMYNYTSNNWSHWNSNKKLKEKFESCTRKTFDRFTTNDSCTWNITHNTESIAV